MRIADTFHNGDVVVMRDYQYQRVFMSQWFIVVSSPFDMQLGTHHFHCLILKSVSLYTIKGHHIPGIVVDPQTWSYIILFMHAMVKKTYYYIALYTWDGHRSMFRWIYIPVLFGFLLEMQDNSLCTSLYYVLIKLFERDIMIMTDLWLMIAMCIDIRIYDISAGIE